MRPAALSLKLPLLRQRQWVRVSEAVSSFVVEKPPKISRLGWRGHILPTVTPDSAVLLLFWCFLDRIHRHGQLFCPYPR